MKNIKICVCGITCSGKTTLLNQVAHKFDIEFIEGSKSLRKIGDIQTREELQFIHKNNTPLMQKLRSKFAKYIKNFNSDKIIIVDGHYSFIKENEQYEVAMSDDDFSAYDVILFLHCDIDKVQERLEQRDNKIISKNDLKKWYEFELEGLKQQCRKHNILFGIIDDEVDYVGQFLRDLNSKPEFLMPNDIFKKFYSSYKKILLPHKKIFVVDCDDTLANQDGVKLFYKIPEMSSYKIPNAFVNHRFYGLYQFFKLTQKRLEIDETKFYKSCQIVANEIVLYKNLIDFLASMDIPVIAITAGIRAIWDFVFKKYKLNFLLVANDRCTCICKETKTYFVQKLVSLGYEVIVIANGKVDIGMFENANMSFLIDSREKDEVLKCLNQVAYSKMKEINYNTSFEEMLHFIKGQ